MSILPRSHLISVSSLQKTEVARVCFTIRLLCLGAIYLSLSQSLDLGFPSLLLMDFVVFFFFHSFSFFLIVPECQLAISGSDQAANHNEIDKMTSFKLAM